MRRARSYRMLGLVLLSLCLAGFAAPAAAEGIGKWLMAPGKAAAELLARSLSNPPAFVIGVGEIKLDGLNRITLTDVTFSDADGVWAVAPEAQLVWKPKLLLEKRAHLENLDIPVLTVTRLPAGGDAGKQASNTVGKEAGGDIGGVTFGWPAPGVGIIIRAAHVRLALPGADAPLQINGALELTDGVLKASLKAVDGTESVHADVDISEADRSIAVDVDVATSPGGPLARLVRLGAMGGRLKINGSGSPDDWSGQILAALPEGDRIEGAIGRTAGTGDRLVFAIDGAAQLTADGLGHADVPSDLAPEIAGPYALKGEITFDGTALETIALGLAGARVDTDLGFVPGTKPDVLALDLRIKDPGVLAPALGDFLFSGARLTGSFDLAGVTQFDGTVSFDDMRSGAVSADRLAGRIHVDFPDMSRPAPHIALTGSGSAAGLSVPGAGAPLTFGSLAWTVSGTWPDGGRLITLDRFALSGGPLKAAGRATITTGSGALDLAGNLVFDDLGMVRDELDTGRYEGAFRLTDTAEGFAFDLDGRVADVAGLDPRVGKLAGAGTFTLRFRQAVDGAPGQLKAQLKSKAVTVKAAARFGDPEAVDADLAFTVSDADAVSGTLGLPVARTTRLETRLRGAFASPAIELHLDSPGIGEGLAHFAGVKLRASLTNAIAAPAGRIDLSAIGPTGRLTAAATVASPDAAHIAVSEIAVDSALVRLAGSLSYDRAQDLLTGRLGGESGDAQALQEALTVEGRGRFALNIAFSAADGRQAIAVNVSGKDVSTVLADRQAVTMDGLEVTGRLGLPGGLGTLGEPEALTFESRLSQLRAGALSLDEVTFRASGLTETFPYELAASGDFFGVIDLTSSGSIGFKGAGYEVAIAELAGTLAGRPLELVTPVTYRRGPHSRLMTPTTLTYGEGRIDVTYDADREDQLLRVEIEDTDAGLMPLFLPIPPISGALDVRLLLEIRDGKASGYAAAAARNIHPRAREDKNFPMDAALSLELDGPVVMVSGRIDGPALTADLVGDIPVRVDPARARLDLADTSPVNATLDWRGSLAPLMAVLPPMNQSFAGDLEGAVTLSGTPGAPRFSGGLALTGGAYENFSFGSRFVDLAGEIQFEGDEVRLARLSGRDLNGGRLSGEGLFKLNPEEDYPGALTLKLDKLKPLELDAATATASGQLTYARTVKLAALEGDLETDRVELRLADKLPTEVTALKVVEINGNDETVSPGAVAVPEARPLIEALDVTVSSDARIFLRGRGLDSEWRGTLRVTGTPTLPRVTGALELVRGTFAFAGRQVDLTEGRLQFTGGETIDPHLQMTGIYDTVSLTAQVQLNGPLSAPEITLSSTPSLPQDEIMARILFGTSVHELTAIEAVQLASAVSSLSGGGGLDVFSRARGMLGLDRLTVEESEETTDGRLVTGGKYLTNNIYLEVQTSTDTGESNAAVRVDITRNLQVESDVGSDNSSRIGIRWKKDY